MTNPLASAYLAYLQVLNERRWSDLDRFVHDEVLYNGTAMTRRQYADAIAADASAIPDLHFSAELLVSGDGLVAARLFFDCTPVRPFRGFDVGGGRVRFAEHVFYRFRDGRIEQVWSLLDGDAIRPTFGAEPGR